MKTLSFSTRFFVAALFLGAACGLLFFSFKTYKRESNIDMPALSKKTAEQRAPLAQELGQAMAQAPVQLSRYRVIEDRNLFTPDRKPWAAPAPEPEKILPVSEVKRTDVQLHGIFRMDNKKYAILSIPMLKSAYPRFTATEGQTLTHDDTPAAAGLDKLSYTVLSIQGDRVLMQDNNGQRFEVTFEQAKSTPSISTAAAAPSAVVVTSQASQGGDNKAKAAAGSVTTKQGRQVDPGLIPKDKREQMIRDGSLVKVKTPFGDMYKYSN